MYLPAAFDERDLAQLDRLARDYPFATVVALSGGEPLVSHVPLLYHRDGDAIELRGHFARANPHARLPGRVRVIFHGPDAYVSPSWYPDKQAASRVPTWNYAVAHLSGELSLFDDEPGLAELVADLSDEHESRAGSDWRFDAVDPAQRVQLRGIIGFRIAVDTVQMKFKLSQNHPPANRAAVASALDAQANDDARAVASLMRAAYTARGNED